MRQFAYISTALSLPEREIESILAASERNNLRSAITGFLLYNGRNFLQVIEGEQADLMALMTRLARDPRHDGIVRLHNEASNGRACPDWRMQRIVLPDPLADRQAMIEGVLPAALHPQLRATVLNFAALN